MRQRTQTRKEKEEVMEVMFEPIYSSLLTYMLEQEGRSFVEKFQQFQEVYQLVTYSNLIHTNEIERCGKEVLEMDWDAIQAIRDTGNARKVNEKMFLAWMVVMFGTVCGVNISTKYNVEPRQCSGITNRFAFNFYNKYEYQHNTEKFLFKVRSLIKRKMKSAHDKLEDFK